MKLKVKKDFKWAHRGVDVKEYAKGDEIEVNPEDQHDQDLVKVSGEEGWTEPVKEKA